MEPKTSGDLFDVLFDSEDMLKLLFRFGINFLFITILIRYIYYRKTSNKDYLFTYYSISIVSFMICFALKKLEINTGMGLGLFAIFGIIRYRTDTVRIREMSYLFIAIGLSVINALAGKQISLGELLFINISVTLVVLGLEYWWLMRQEAVKSIVYEKIENIKPENYQALLDDLQARTGLKIKRAEIGKIDFLKDTAQVKIYYMPHEQTEAFSTDHED
ncbi:MAG: DUF4956 domain-containing protein [Crocinitomicaceae bacterium]|nr:DUF4956 domain-containing protein [Crocinitomicaceae bacterium]MBK8925281.1 DUF4956 domain-containing protein [Crocinitomicaceae bacterium]